jgi:HK97 family phage prohead protease
LKKLLAQLIAAMKQEEGLEVQTLLFSKETFPEESDATTWATDHGFKADKVDDEEGVWRVRQFEPDLCIRDSFKTWDLDEGVQATGCKVKEEERAGMGRRSVPTGTPKFAEFQVKRGGINAAKRSVEGWASLEMLDRHGELMLASAFEKHLEKYLANPVLCWCHNIMAPPIGHTEIEIVPEKGLRMTAFFASTDFAKEIFTLFKDRALRAFSVQFFPHEVRDSTDEEREKHGAKLQRTITEAELYEISPVPVPAVAYALAGKAAKGLLPVNSWEATSLEMFARKSEAGDPAGDPPGDPPPPAVKGARETLEEIGAHVEAIATLVADGLAEDPGEPDPDDDPAGGDGDGDGDEPTPDQEEELERLMNSITDTTKTRAGSEA